MTKDTHRPKVLRYRGTSLIRKRTPLGPYSRPTPRVLGGSEGVGRFLVTEVSLKGLVRLPRRGALPSDLAQVRQSGPDSGPGFQVKQLEPFQVVPFLLGRGVWVGACGALLLERTLQRAWLMYYVHYSSNSSNSTAPRLELCS